MGTRLSKAYMLTKVLTASNQEVVVYLYQGAISFLHRAITAMREGERAAAGKALERTINILVELSGSLNYSASPHLATRLDSLYTYLIHSLSLAGGKGDVEALESCEGILSILYDAWQQAAASDQASAPAKPARQLQISA
jgi:flagellar protein FliS